MGDVITLLIGVPMLYYAVTFWIDLGKKFTGKYQIVKRDEPLVK